MSIGNGTNETEEPDFYFYLILIIHNLNDHLWLIAALLNSTVARYIQNYITDILDSISILAVELARIEPPNSV